MPVRNEVLWIERSVSAVLRQDYPPECIEIIVADGLSEDETIAVIRRLPEANRVRIISNSHRIQSAGMNAAIQLARGDIIIRVDGHTVVSPNYVSNCVEVLQKTHADNVGGSIYFMGSTSIGRAIALASKSSFAVPTVFRVSTKPQYTDTVYMGAWQRQVFERVGLFDEGFSVNEDYEFNFRIRKAGGKIYFTPDICSEYYGQQTLIALARQYFRYGNSKPQTLLKHPQSAHARHFVAPLFIVFLLAGAPLRQLVPPTTVLWILGITLYLLTNIGFAVYIGWRLGLMVPLRVSSVFLTIHMAWGIGFWFGLIRLLIQRLVRNFAKEW